MFLFCSPKDIANLKNEIEKRSKEGGDNVVTDTAATISEEESQTSPNNNATSNGKSIEAPTSQIESVAS